MRALEVKRLKAAQKPGRAQTPGRETPGSTTTAAMTPQSAVTLQRSIGNAGFGRALAATPVQRAGGKKPDWKNKSTKEALRTVKHRHKDDPLVLALVDTLHHVVPKSALSQYATLLDNDQLRSVVSTLKPVAKSAFKNDQAALADVSLALKNIPSNYVLGPRPEERSDDPGNSGADLNRTSSGSVTPRSKQLELVYEHVVAAVEAGEPLGNTELKEGFLRPLKKACEMHVAIGAERGYDDVGLDEHRGHWEKTSGKYHRRKK